jgi:hypothetical protein
MQLQSGESFVIVRQLKDPQDTGTYYVRAYIRKSLDDTLLDTIDLTDAGSQRFKKTWQVASDPSGLGMYVDITTRVFTDSGYTTESDVYQKENYEYLIAQRYNPVYGGGGGGSSIDYKKVRQIVKEEIDKIPQVEIPKQKEIDLKPVLEAIDGIEVSPIVKTEKIELGGIIRLIEGVRMAIESLPKPKDPEKVDFSGIYSEINKIEKRLNVLWEENKNISEESKKRIQDTVDNLLNNIKDKTFIALNSVEEKPKNEKPWRKFY